MTGERWSGVKETLGRLADDDRSTMSRFLAWRIEQGWTQAEVADLCGLSASLISRVESGERALSPATKVRVSRALGVSVVTLFEPPSDPTIEGPVTTKRHHPPRSGP